MKKYKILAVLPESIGGRLTTSSIIDGFRQNNCEISIYDELRQNNFESFLNNPYDFILGYDFSPVKLKIDNNLKLPCLAYFSDDINLKTAGVGYKEYKKYLYDNDNFIVYWDRFLTKIENRPNIAYLPHFVNLKIYRDFKKPKYDVAFMGRLDTDLRLDLFINLSKLLNNRTIHWYAIKKHYLDAYSRADEAGKEILERSYGGFIDNEKDMSKMINNHKIIYNVNSQGVSSLNYRSIQTLASKRLLISDEREELDLFKNKVPIYKDVQDLALKIQYYLNYKDEYQNIVDFCYEIIKKNHCAKKCTEKMIEFVQKNSCLC